MKRFVSRGAAGVAAAALLVSSLLVTATAANADPGDGTVVVSIVDQYGRPTAGIAQAYAAGGRPYDQLAWPTGGSTVTLTLPADAYGLAVITPWSGYTCEGLAPCGLAATPVVTPVVTVTSGSTSTYTAHVTVPSITGGTKVGRQHLQVPAGHRHPARSAARRRPGGGLPAAAVGARDDGRPGSDRELLHHDVRRRLARR